MEERLRPDMAFRWFCKFSITDETPDHSFFCRARKSIGTKNIGLFFESINKVARGKDKYWFGYKRHQSVDAASRLIEKVAITSANVKMPKG